MLLGREECDEIDDQKDEDERLLAVEAKHLFVRCNIAFNFSKRKATDMKGNSRVHFPSKAKNLHWKLLGWS